MNLDSGSVSRMAWLHLWQLTVVAIAVGAVVRSTCRHRPRLAYSLWILVLVKALVPPAWSSPTGIFCWLLAEDPGTATGRPGRDADPPGPAGMIAPHAAQPVDPVAPDVVGRTTDDPIGRPAGSPLSLVLPAIWLSGALVGSAILLVRRRACMRLLGRMSRPADRDSNAVAVELAMRLNVRRRVRLLVSRQFVGPLVYGLLRPTLVLPELLLSQASPEQVRLVLAHELVHVRRGDAFAGLLQTLTQLLWWFHPLVWWASREAGRERERCCDREVVSALGCSPAAYARTLLKVLELKAASQPDVAVPGIGHSQVTARRLEDIMRHANSHHRFATFLPRFVFAVGIVSLMPGMGLSRDEESRGDGVGPVTTLDQPVAPQDDGHPDARAPMTVTGGVVDEAGRPVAGAEILVRRTEWDRSARGGVKPVSQARTGTDGEGHYRATIPGLDPDAGDDIDAGDNIIEVTADHPDYTPATLRDAASLILADRRGGPGPTLSRIVLHPAKPITARVVTPEGRPMVGLPVLGAWLRPSSTGRVVAETDAEGRFRLKVPAEGDVSLQIFPEDYAPVSQMIGERGDLGQIVMRPGLRLRGRVFDSTGRPLAGVAVNAGGQRPPLFRQAVTDPEGRFAFEPLPAGTFSVGPAQNIIDLKTGFGSFRPLPAAFPAGGVEVILKEGVEPARIEIRAVPHVAVEAIFLDSVGRPCEGRTLVIHSGPDSGQAGRLAPGFWMASAQSGPDGHAVVLAPRGIEDAQLGAMPTLDHAHRYERPAGQPIPGSREDLSLGRLARDVGGITVRVYRSPVVILAVSAVRGETPDGMKITARYGDERPERRWNFRLDGTTFETDLMTVRRQADGRSQVRNILPGAPVSFSAEAEGYRTATATLTLSEGDRKELKLILERR